MKFNKWTLGLAAVGAVSLASVAQAEEQSVLTALSSTTLSGYVNTSIHWNINEGNANAAGYSYNSGKQDGFNLDVVQLTLEKPLDESEWASGYKVDLVMGPDAAALATTSGGSSPEDFAIKQAYVALRTPVGNGIDWKVGVFDTIIGYEVFEAGNNPNYTRSYGYSIEPTTHTGVLASYRINDYVSASAGVANTTIAAINSRDTDNDWSKTYMASVAVTAPDDLGFLSGSTVYGGVVSGTPGSSSSQQNNWYAGVTMATPVEGLTVGASYDSRDIKGSGPDAEAVALYASFRATEKITLHGRGEYFVRETFSDSNNEIWALTGTVQYDLWKNVISRLEARWDHSPDGKEFGGTGSASKNSEFLLAANLIYKF